MSKKQKRRSASTTRKPAQISPEALAQQARQDLESGRFRDAVNGFKQLLKLEARPEWRAGLADAYAGRARELTAKDMVKEAMVMWDNRAALGPDVPASVDHLALLLQTGRIQSVLEQLSKADGIPAADRERLRSVLAARTLTGGAEILNGLPPEDPIRRQAPAAAAALDAYCAGDEPALRAALSEIPFRSPYRDLAQILKALQMLPESTAEAAKTLSRVSPDSGFAPLKAAAELALLPESDFLHEALGNGGSKTRLACVLRGWSDARIAMLEELRKLGLQPKPDALIGYLYKHRGALGEPWARRKSLHLLAPQFPESLSWLANVGAAPASRLERALLAAWEAELHGDSWDMTEAWAAVAAEIKQAMGDSKARPDDRLRVALALRRTDQLTNILCADPSSGGAPEDVEHEAAKHAEESLEWDPEDRDTYLRLIDYYRGRQQPKEARRLISAATERWPEDMRILQASMRTAIDSGAFKKASTIARRILEIDPINSSVRDALVDAHLAHTRKQLIGRRPDLAEKELVAAREWARSEHGREQIEILTGLTRLATDSAAGVEMLRAVADRLGQGLTARLLIAQASDSAGRAPDPLLKTLGLNKVVAPKQDDVLAALSRLRRLLDSGAPLSTRLRGTITQSFSKTRWKDLPRAELESACETLRRAELGEVREQAARSALKNWRGAPIFQLHLFEAKYPNGCYDPYNRDVVDLETALLRAKSEGDTRTAMRIETALRSTRNPFGSGGRFPFDFPFFDDMDDDDDDDFEIDFGHAKGPMDEFMDMIDEHGLEKAMDILNVPQDVRKELRAIARDHGEGAVSAVLDILLSQIEKLDPRGLPPLPPPSNRAKPKPKPKPKQRKKPDDDDPSVQLDLFS